MWSSVATLLLPRSFLGLRATALSCYFFRSGFYSTLLLLQGTVGSLLPSLVRFLLSVPAFYHRVAMWIGALSESLYWQA